MVVRTKKAGAGRDGEEE